MKNFKWNVSVPEFSIGDYFVTKINTDEEINEIINRIQHASDFLKDKAIKNEVCIFTITDFCFIEVAILCLEINSNDITILDLQTIWGSDDMINEITDVTDIGNKDRYKELNKEIEHVAYEILRLIKA